MRPAKTNFRDSVETPYSGTRPFPPLLAAAASPSINTFKHILDSTSDISMTENGRGARNALHIAAVANQPQNVSLLLRANVNMHARAKRGITPLWLACMCGHREVLRVLIEEGNADSNARDTNLCTPLHAAVMHGHSATTIVLLEYGADLWLIEATKWTALYAAILKGHKEIVKMLTQAMKTPNAKLNKPKWRPFKTPAWSLLLSATSLIRLPTPWGYHLSLKTLYKEIWLTTIQVSHPPFSVLVLKFLLFYPPNSLRVLSPDESSTIFPSLPFPRAFLLSPFLLFIFFHLISFHFIPFPKSVFFFPFLFRLLFLQYHGIRKNISFNFNPCYFI